MELLYRSFQRTSLFSITTICLLLSGLLSAAERPNIVLILTDDLGYGDVSFLNTKSDKVQTPHMDRLAQDGVYATDAHSPSGVCSPTRYSILTGRYPWRNEHVRSGVVSPWDDPVIDADRETLPKMLKRRGYETLLIGKWHLGFTWPWAGGKKPDRKTFNRGSTSLATADMFDFTRPITGGPLEAGFDYYFGDDLPNMPPYCFIENDSLTIPPEEVVTLDGRKFKSLGAKGYIHGTGPGVEGWDLTELMPKLTERTVEVIHKRADSEQPYFLMFSTTSPHTPVVPTREFQGTSEAGTYGDFVVQTDAAIGEVVAALKKTGQWDNTLLIVTSDNGPSGHHRDLIKRGHYPAGHWRGMKQDSWEGGHRVPFFATWPEGGLSGGREVEALISLVDLYATFAALLDEDVPEGIAEDSLNIWPSLQDNRVVRIETIYHEKNGSLGLRQGDWVYLSNGGREEPDWYKERWGIPADTASPYLFNLADNPTQTNNLATANPERLKVMELQLQKIKTGNSTRK